MVVVVVDEERERGVLWLWLFSSRIEGWSCTRIQPPLLCCVLLCVVVVAAVAVEWFIVLTE